MTFKVIIAGSRDFADYNLLAQRCDHLLSQVTEPIEVVSGTARGADRLGELYANARGYSLVKFPAQWSKFGRSAGPIRNRQMAEYANALIAFPLGKSFGTRNMITTAKKLGLSVRYGTNPSPSSFFAGVCRQRELKL